MEPLEARRDVVVGATRTLESFSRRVLRRPLRQYQLAPARAIVDSVLHRRGLTFAVMMSRQAGKNETAAHIEAFLLNRYRRDGGDIVKAAPSFRPQAITSLLRLEGLLAGSLLGAAQREEGYSVRLGRARALFLSGAPEAHVVGATASLLLEGDEAQDLDPEVWDRSFRPMAASTNATTVLWGTAWTATTLLARTIRELHAQEVRDGLRRVFTVSWETVAAEAPAYGAFVRGEIARLGFDHPLIRTQYRVQEIDGQAGMFPPAIRRLMQGAHPRLRGPQAGGNYALLVDVGGGAEEGGLRDVARRQAATRRDATALTVVEIVQAIGPLPRYHVVDRVLWVGAPHDELYGALLRWAELWGAARIVIDATGLGAPLAQSLARALGARVRPLVFTAASKSALGWGFLALCGAGRFADHAPDGSPEQELFWRQAAAADFTVVDGPGRLMRWGVADAALHDDLLISAALCALLEQEPPSSGASAQIIEAPDPLRGEARADDL